MKPSNHYREVCGIIGGVGPAATYYLCNLILSVRKAGTDQDHIPLLIFNNPQIPDRTAHIVYGGQSPLPELIHSAEVLKKSGATFLAIPCNSSHAYIKEVEQAAGIQTLNMIQITARHMISTYGNNLTVGLLATDGTIKSGTYQKEMDGITILTPDKQGQKNIMGVIYGAHGIKAGYLNTHNFTMLHREAKKLISRGARVIIAGCTEIPLVFPQRKVKFTVIDPMEILARQIVDITLSSKLLS